MEITGWISYSSLSPSTDKGIGFIGGCFHRGMRWVDYLNSLKTNLQRKQVEAVREAILDRGLKCSGEEHQNTLEKVPTFGDGTYLTFSYSAWGDLMAAVWSEEENKDYTYMEFYI